MRKEFTKSDLENGMVIECRNGLRYVVMNENLIRNEGFLELSDVREDLTDVDDEEWDVVKIYKSTATRLDNLFSNCELEYIWGRDGYDTEYKLGTLEIKPNEDTYLDCEVMEGNYFSYPIFIERSDGEDNITLTFDEARFLAESLIEIIEKVKK